MNRIAMDISCLLKLLIGCCVVALTACAANPQASFDTHLAGMSDEALFNYYQGLNDRIKDIQAGTKEAETQGILLSDDHVARMPYVIGCEAWGLEQKAVKIKQELDRRKIDH